MLRDFALDHVGPGWKVYSTTRFVAGDPELPEPIGGTVVEVFPPFTDAETGELVPARYRCLSTFRRQQPWQILTADEVDLSQLCGVDRTACNAGAVFLLDPIFRGRKRVSLRGRDDVEAIHDAWRLAAAWAGIR